MLSIMLTLCHSARVTTTIIRHGKNIVNEASTTPTAERESKAFETHQKLSVSIVAPIPRYSPASRRSKLISLGCLTGGDADWTKRQTRNATRARTR